MNEIDDCQHTMVRKQQNITLQTTANCFVAVIGYF